MNYASYANEVPWKKKFRRKIIKIFKYNLSMS